MLMRPSPSLLLCFSALVLLTACAKKKDSSGTPSSAIYTIPADSLSEAQKKAQNATVTCAGDCSPSVGLLAMANPTNGGQCTASLIGEDLVVTNSHCVADDLKAPGSSCKGRVWLHFTADASHPEYDSRLECEKVLYASPEDGEVSSPDYAYLKLSRKSNRPTLRFSRAGFADGETVTLHKVSPTRIPGKLTGEQATTSCRAIQNTAVVDKVSHSQAHVAMLSDCTVVHGNSGGPVLGADGSAKGVIFAFIQPEVLRRRLLKKPGAKLKEALAPLNLASNFACLREHDDPTAARLPGHCENLKNIEDARAEAAKSSAADQLVEAFLREQNAPLQRKLPGIAWSQEFVTVNNTREVQPVPYCVNAAAITKYVGKKITFERPITQMIEAYDRYTRRIPALDPIRSDLTVMNITSSRGAYSAHLSGSSKLHNVILCP